jgi:hypothetical protein
MEIINDEANSDIIAWTPEGNGFTILNKNRLATEVLPKMFKMTQYTSFTRRLKRWGFIIRRTTHGGYASSYHHPLFTKDDVSNIFKMRPLSRRHQYRKRGGNQSEQFNLGNQMPQILPAGMIPIYTMPGVNPTYGVPVAYYDQLGLMNFASNGSPSLMPGLGGVMMIPNAQTALPSYGNYLENFNNVSMMNFSNNAGNHSNSEALQMMMNPNVETMYANSQSNYRTNDATFQPSSVMSQNENVMDSSYQTGPSRAQERSAGRNQMSYFSPSRYS